MPPSRHKEWAEIRAAPALRDDETVRRSPQRTTVSRCANAQPPGRARLPALGLLCAAGTVLCALRAYVVIGHVVRMPAPVVEPAP